MFEKIKKFLTENFMIFFIVYYCTLFLDTTTLEIDYGFIEVFSKIVRYITYSFFALRFICLIPDYVCDLKKMRNSNHSKVNMIIYIISFILIISLCLNFIKTGNKRLLFLLLVILSAYRTDYKKIIKYTMNLQIILTCILVLLCSFGVTQNYIVHRGEINRNSLGFVYTTNFAQMILFSSILYLYCNGKKTKLIDLCIVQGLNAVMYFLTNSRTEFIVLEIVIVIYAIYIIFKSKIKFSTINKIKEKYSYLFTISFPIYPICSFVVTILYKYGGIWNKLNNLLSNRLKQTYNNIQIYGLTFFGEDIEFLGNGIREKMKYGRYVSNYVDNEYLQLMFSYGIIFILSFISIITIFLFLLYKRKQYKDIILCSIYLIFGLMNPRIVNLLYCPILFMIIPTFISYNEEYNMTQQDEQKGKLHVKEKFN